MRTASQCLALAALLDDRAARDSRMDMRADWTVMASHWRRLARQADWQDRFHARSP